MRFLAVQEDPRIGYVAEMLPHTNCGACGQPGCSAFAEALVDGRILPGKCSVVTTDDHAKIASFLGVDVGAEEKLVARVACASGEDVAQYNAQFAGTQSCAAATLVGGGGKACLYGCL